ncbi:MAG: patatin-like phospholipase family protein [Cyclonatronaceae bacterium]
MCVISGKCRIYAILLALSLSATGVAARPTVTMSSDAGDRKAVVIRTDSAETNAPERDRKPDFDQDFVVGLTLSGGGAAGLAHIGVLRVLEEAGIPVDLVTGTSMGAIVGALYAIGYTPDQMEQEVRKADWRQLFEERVYRHHLPMDEKRYDGLFNLSLPVEGRKVQLPTGLVSGNLIFNLLARLTWSYHDQSDFLELPRPFLCIATDLENGEQVILDNGFLPDAIRASMSIPTFLDPVWLEGRYLMDGGVVNNLPVKEAYELGADFVIAVNSSSDLKPADELNTLPDILTQTITVGMRVSMQLQRKRADFYIQPDLSPWTTLSFGEVEEIIQAGEQAALARIDEIRALADSLDRLRGSAAGRTVPPFEPMGSLRIRSVSFEGLTTVPEDHIRSKLQIFSGTVIDEQSLSEGIMRLYGMQRFNRVTYRIRHRDDSDEVDLVIYLEEQIANIVQTGIFHNSRTGPSILFNATLRNMIFQASTARLNVRFGHELMAEAQYFNYIGFERRLAFSGSAGYRERELDIYRGGRHEASVRTEIFYAEGLTGPHIASFARLGLGYRFEYFNLNESVGFIDIHDDWSRLHLLVGELEFDNLNRTILPTSGFHFSTRSDLAPRFLPGETAFGRIEVFWKGHYTISERFSLLQSLQGGYSFGDALPLHYRHYAGGYPGFPGYPKDAVAGNNILAAGVGARYRFYGNFYLTSKLQAGDAHKRLNHRFFDKVPKWGWATAVSWNSALGPIHAILSGSGDHILLFEFQVGMNFPY